MRLLLTFVTVLAFTSVSPHACAQEAGPVGLWRQTKIDWVHAPKEIGKEKTGNAGIMRFGADGSFVLVYASVIVKAGFPEVMSQGDPWTIYRGTWKTSTDGIHLSYSLLYRDIPCEKCPSVQTVILKRKGKRVVLQGIAYQPEPALAPSFEATFSSFAAQVQPPS